MAATIQVVIAKAGRLGMQIGVHPKTGMTVLLKDPAPGALVAEANAFIRKGDRLVSINDKRLMTFENADVDGDGLVDADELASMLKKMGRKHDRKTVGKMFAKYAATSSPWFEPAVPKYCFSRSKSSVKSPPQRARSLVIIGPKRPGAAASLRSDESRAPM